MNAPLKKLSELTGLAFDGVRSGYVPPKRLRISKKLRLHTRARRDIDPVTFEVVRHLRIASTVAPRLGPASRT